jgi:peroxiredoxin
MLLLSRSWTFIVMAVTVVMVGGCQSKSPEKPIEQKPAAAAARHKAIEPAKQSAVEQPEANAEHKVAHAKPKRQETPPPPPAIPKVALSGELREACLLNVGDTMPKVELVGLDGKPHSLESLYGHKLTVVCFWTVGTTRRAKLVVSAALQDLMKQVVEPFSTKGVGVVGISVQGTADAVRQEADQVGATFPILLDSKGDTFAKVAKDDRVPRIYLLDAAGRVLWFDVEYSRASRRDLLLGIRVALGEL